MNKLVRQISEVTIIISLHSANSTTIDAIASICKLHAMAIAVCIPYILGVYQLCLSQFEGHCGMSLLGVSVLGDFLLDAPLQ